MYLSEVCKIINAGPPVDTNTAGLDGAYVSMKDYKHLTAIIQSGVSAGAVSTITVEKDADGSGVGTAIGFNARLCSTAYNAAGGDTLAAATAVAATGQAMSTTDNTFVVIELDADELGGAHQWVRVRLSDPGAAQLASIIYILSGPRYAETTASTLTV